MENNCYSYGPRDSKIAFIAEAPADREIAQNQPLVGPSGQIFDICLSAARLNRRRAYIGNVCRGRIRDGSEIVSKEKWTTRGLEEYNAFVERLQEVEANVFVAMGNISLYALTGESGITKWRGSILPCTVTGLEDRKVIPTYHPAATLRGMSKWKHDIAIDFTRARQEQGTREIPGLGGLLQPDPDFGACVAALDMCQNRMVFAHDIEVYNGHISCMSFGMRDVMGTARSICIPFYDANQPSKARWIESQEQELWLRIGSLLGNPDNTIIGQNYIFDASVLIQKNNIVPTARIEDCMVAHSIMYPDTPKGLDYLCSVYTNIPYYKDDVKLWNKLDDGFQDTFWEYSAKDALATLLCWEAIWGDIKGDEEHLRTYRNTVDLYPALLYMGAKGIRFDRALQHELRGDSAKELEGKLQELHESAEYPFNPGSPKQTAAYFYDHKGLRPYKSRAGSTTTDNDALRRIYLRDGIEEARLCQEYRAIKKFIGDSLSVVPDADGRMRCSLNPRGTRFGRISTSKTVFGTGTNMQNRESRFKTLLKPDPSHAFFEFDLAGAEWVVVAYLTGDERMIAVAEGGDSPHTKTAEMMFKLDPDLIKKEDKALGHLTDTATLFARRQEEFPELLSPGVFVPRNMTARQGGKRCNHGFNYDLGYRSFGIKYDIAEPEAKRLHALYRRIYDIEAFHGEVVRQLRDNNRTLVNLLGRKYRFLGNMNDELFKAAYSFIPQSTIVDLMNLGIRNVWGDPHLQHWEPLMQVHDSCLYQTQVDFMHPTDWHELASNIQDVTEHLTTPLVYKGHEFTIGVELKVSRVDWSHMTEIHLSDSLDAMAEQLENTLGSEAQRS